MRIVGLTGGIGSGKSTVSQLFKANGIPPSMLTSLLARKGTGGWRKVVAAFGSDILLPSREVDRPMLGQIVFNDPDKRQLLNSLLAPYISSGILEELLKLWMKGCKIVVLNVPKWTGRLLPLLWSGWILRLGLNALCLRGQMHLDLKKEKADIVIDNSGSLDDLNESFREGIKKPLTWTEFGLSRDGALVAFVSFLCGVT